MDEQEQALLMAELKAAQEKIVELEEKLLEYVDREVLAVQKQIEAIRAEFGRRGSSST